MIYKITHTTTYEYADAVSLSHHLLRLAPRNLENQRCLSQELQVLPEPTLAKRHVDYFGNEVAFLTIEGAHNKLVVKSVSDVSVTSPATHSPMETPDWETVRDSCRGQQMGHALDASEFIFDSPLVRATESFADYAAPSFTKERPILEAAIDLTRRIHADFKFDPKATTLATPLEEVFKNRRGVCQDFAQFQIACFRSLGLPARYVSGYLETDPPPGKPRFAGADASHAWISFYCHSIGWIDLDPTNNVLPTTRHIAVAYGRDYDDVSPIRGVILGAGEHTLKVAVDVTAVAEDAKEPSTISPTNAIAT